MSQYNSDYEIGMEELEKKHREVELYKQLLKSKFLELRKKEIDLRRREIELDNREFELKSDKRDLSWIEEDIKNREEAVNRAEGRIKKRKQLEPFPESKSNVQVLKTDNALKEKNEVRKILQNAAAKIVNADNKKENKRKSEDQTTGHKKEIKEDEERWSITTQRQVAGAKYSELILGNGYAPYDLKEFIKKIKPAIHRKLIAEMLPKKGLKFQVIISVQMEKYEANDEEMIYQYPYFVSKMEEVLTKDDIEDKIEQAFIKIYVSLGNFSRGSGWSPRIVEELVLKTVPFDPFKSENNSANNTEPTRRRIVKSKVSGSSYITTPAWIQNKKAVINVENLNDNKCFRWALKSALFPVKNHVNRTGVYPKDEDDNLDFTGIDYPVKIKDIPRFERQNSLGINVFRLDGIKICPLFISKQEKSIKRINLLLLEEESEYHYTWVKDIHKFLHGQKTHHGNRYYCEICITSNYATEKELAAHKEVCNGRDAPTVRIEMPKEGKNVIKFKNLRNKMKVPFVVYADFESINEKIQSVSPSSDKTSTTHVQKQSASAFCYVVVRSDGHVYDPVEYRGPNAAAKFLETVQRTEKNIRETFNREPMNLTEDEEERFTESRHCHICDGEFNPFTPDDKVRDHDHITGEFRGAAHKICNLSWSIIPETMKIPVFFHNLRGYDAHLIMQEIYGCVGEVKCLAKNTEQYICFSIGGLQFLDSFQFLSSSLDKLAAGNESFPILHKKGNYQNKIKNWEEKVKLLTRKGVYPYDFVDSMEKYEETLPGKEEFYNQLNRSEISDSDYQHACKVYKEFGCRNMGDYCDLYCRTDVLLLADIFENYRKVTRKTYMLDPARYMSSPGIAWDALLMKTGIELELITDYDKLLMIEKGLRGGISMVSKRFARANNHMVPGFNPEKEKSWLMYLDANNLYGWAMSQPMPNGNVQWVPEEEIEKIDFLNVNDDAETGYILEVDLEYPAELHNSHCSYPLAPEKKAVRQEWLSDFQNYLLGGKRVDTYKRILNTLEDKNKYVIHYRNLKLYVELGMKLKRIHRVLSFKQSRWMEPYISMNTELRKKAKTSFEKDLFKLMNNSVYGKTLENVHKRIDFRIARADEEGKIRKLSQALVYNLL